MPYYQLSIGHIPVLVQRASWICEPKRLLFSNWPRSLLIGAFGCALGFGIDICKRRKIPVAEATSSARFGLTTES
jgi:hypothetical protein